MKIINAMQCMGAKTTAEADSFLVSNLPRCYEYAR